jgi:hypothetical protein
MKEAGIMPLGEALVNVYEFKFWGDLWVAGGGPYKAHTPCCVTREGEIAPEPYDRFWSLAIVSDISDDFSPEAWEDQHLHALIFDRDCEPDGWLHRTMMTKDHIKNKP